MAKLNTKYIDKIKQASNNLKDEVKYDVKDWASRAKKRPVRTTLGTALRAPGKVIEGVADVASSAIVGVPSTIYKGAQKVPGLREATRLTKETEPGIANLWTGRREGAGAIVAATGVGAAYAAYQSANQTVLAPKTGQVSYGGTAPVMNADGVSSTSQAPTLGANGNMVFGLHNARKG